MSTELGVIAHNGLESRLDRGDAFTEHSHPLHQEHAFVRHKQAERFRELLSAEDLAQRKLRDLVTCQGRPCDRPSWQDKILALDA